MSKALKGIAAVAAAGLIAGCSGGSNSPLSPATKPNPGASAGAPASTAGKVTGSLEVRLMSRKSAKRLPMNSRKPDYISPATSGIFATFVSDATTAASPSPALRSRDAVASPSPMPSASASPASTTTTQGYTLAPGQTATATSPATCGALQSDGSYTCTLYFALSPSSSPYAVTLTAYDTAQSGTTLAAGNALSTDSQTETVTANQSNTFDFALQGIVQGFNVTPQYVGVSQGGTVSGGTATFTALDADDYEIDSVDVATNFAVGTQQGGPFDLNASFGVNAIDAGPCADKTGKCLSSTSTAVTNPASEAVNYSYDGNGSPGDGTSAPYYGLVSLSEPAGYSGFTSGSFGTPPTNYAGTFYVVPLFGLVDQTSAYAAAGSTSTVDFTGSGESLTGYALQYHVPTGSTGSSIDYSSCSTQNGDIATFTNVATITYGTSFTIASGSAQGSCTVDISDGAGDTATITVNNGSTSTTATVPSPGPSYQPNAKKGR